MSSKLFLLCFLVAMLQGTATTQQPNSVAASMTIDGFDDGNYPLAPQLASPGWAHVQFAGAPNQPFLLFAGPVGAGAGNAGAIGLVDLDFTSASFSLLLNGASPQNALDGLAVLDAGGSADLVLPLPLGFSGSFGGLQALVAAPATAAGWRLSAANEVTILAGFTLSLLSPQMGPPSGAQMVTLVGSGFVPGVPVSVQFGSFQAPFASVLSSTMIQISTPVNFPGTTVDVSVTQAGLTRVLSAAYAYDPVSYQPVLINEVHTGNPDYVELFNPGLLPVDISGWGVHSWYNGTTPDTGSPYVFPFGTILPPQGIIVVEEFGQAQMPGSLPFSISTGNNFWWSGAREVEVALVDSSGLGVDYVHRLWTGTTQAPNMPFPLAWTGSITTAEDNLSRHSSSDSDDASDFTLSAAGTPGFPNPGQ